MTRNGPSPAGHVQRTIHDSGNVRDRAWRSPPNRRYGALGRVTEKKYGSYGKNCMVYVRRTARRMRTRTFWRWRRWCEGGGRLCELWGSCYERVAARMVGPEDGAGLEHCRPATRTWASKRRYGHQHGLSGFSCIHLFIWAGHRPDTVSASFINASKDTHHQQDILPTASGLSTRLL